MHDLLFEFCNHTLSAVYLVAVKDRLYCDKPDSPRRRRTQAVVFEIVDGLTRLIAPILPHTAEEAWRALHGESRGSVHLQQFPDPPAVSVDSNWPRVIEARDAWLKAIEDARSAQDVDNPLDLGLTVHHSEAWSFLTDFDPVDLADLCSVSRVTLAQTDGLSSEEGVKVEVHDLRGEPRCDRCWKRDGTVRQRSDGGMLSDRDALALGLSD